MSKKIISKFLIVISSLFFLFLFAAQPAFATSFSFGAAGDFGAGSNFLSNMKLLGAQSVLGTNPIKFFLAEGDLSYGNSPSTWCANVKANINTGAGKATSDTWGQTYPFEIVSGNHDDDVASSLIDNFVTSSCLPNRMPNAVLSPNGTSNYAKEYYFDYPATNPIARFIFISPGLNFTNGGNYSYAAGSARYNWVKNTIDNAKASGIPWVIANMHHNAIETGPKPNQVGADLWNLFLSKDSAGRQRVDLILQGHSHAYERSFGLAVGQAGCTSFAFGAFNSNCVVSSGNTTTKNTGTVLVINGTGGNGIYALNSADAENKYFAAYEGSTTGSESKPAGGNGTWGIIKITISDSPMQLTGQYLRAAGGNFTDSFSIVASGVASPTPGAPTPTPVPTPSRSPTPIPTKTPTPTPVKTPTPNPSTTPIPIQTIDVNSDRAINILDIGILIDNYNKTPIPNIRADINGDGSVNIIDIGILIDHYNQTY